jgi:hypothetical protein
MSGSSRKIKPALSNTMRTFNGIKKLTLAVVVSGLAAWQATAVIVYDNSGCIGNVSLSGGPGPYAVGHDFTVITAGYVNAVGVFDAANNVGGGFVGDGFVGTVQVAIYSVDPGGATGSLIPGTLMSFTGTAGILTGSTRFLTIAPVLLSPGTYSIVAANLGGTTGDDLWSYFWPGGAPPAFNSVGGGLAVGPSRYVASGSMVYPTLSSPTLGVGAGSFDFEFAVPEASEFALAGVGLLGLVYIGRCYVLRPKVA